MISGQVREEVQRDIADALKLGISGTPLLVVNGRVYYSALSEQQLEILVSELLAGKELTIPTE
jgi:protein-disulfide isomerase